MIVGVFVGNVPPARFTAVIILAVGSAIMLVSIPASLYLNHRQRKRAAPDEPGVEGSMPRSRSEPGHIVVPDDAPTQDAPAVPDDAPADSARPAPGQSAAK